MSNVFARVAVAFLIVASALPASAATQIKLLFTQGANNLGAYVGKDQGFFEKHGLDVDVTPTANGSLVSASLVADAAQIGTLTPSILLEADEQGLDLVGTPAWRPIRRIRQRRSWRAPAAASKLRRI